VEASPSGSHVIWPEPEGWLVHTDHFLNEAAAWCASGRTRSCAGGMRGSRWSTSAAALTDADLQAVLRSHYYQPLSVCCHDGDHPLHADRQQTLASVLIDPTRLRLTVANGAPCEAPYVDVETGAGELSGQR